MNDATGTRQLVVCTLAREQYAMPIKYLQESVRYTQPRSVASGSFDGRGVLSQHRTLMTICHFAAGLGTSSQISHRSRTRIIETGSETVGIMTNGVEEILMVDESQIDPAPAVDTTLVESIAIDQRLVVLLNTGSLFGTFTTEL